MSVGVILDDVQQYYSQKIQAHGATAQGVDWNSTESQQLRFTQLLKVCDSGAPFSINDYGCGYGALADYLRDAAYTFDYCGFDISAPMITKARELHATMSQVAFVCEENDLSTTDYTV